MKNNNGIDQARYFIYNVMTRAGMSVPEFAKAIGVTESCVGYWLRGVTKPSKRNWAKIVKFNK